MVKLKVYVRVIPESAYGADAATAAPRKFVVVVRDPTEWHIGTLAREAQRSYQRLYRHELGKVKYLKDGDDNDLDPEQYVSDIFVNEGKAARDGLDQEAIIKIVQEQGHAVRADSVVPDLTPAHYSQPPPSRLLGCQSSLGKRSHGAIGGLQEAGVVKRSKLVEIPESQDVVPSVERSPELIHDTQRARAEDDIFDDAKEYHPSNAPDDATTTLPPVTPSVNALPNGTTTRSPMQQASSASRFRVGNHRDPYAFPESDIEDSQMVNALPEIAINGTHSSQPTNQNSSQAGPLPKAVTEFNAEESLYPMDLDKAISISAVPQKASDTSPRKKDAVLNETKSSDSGNESSDQEPAELKIRKATQPPAAAKEKRSTDSPESKRQKTPKLVNGTAQNEKKQAQTAPRKSPISNTKGRKHSQGDSVSKPGQLQPALTLSPSGRNSGVVSELDSPGEQLSQGLNESTKVQQLADGLRTSLAGKARNKKQRLRDERFERKSSPSASSSVSGSRPGSREGPANNAISTKTAKKQSQGNGPDEQQLQKQISSGGPSGKVHANTKAAKSDKPTKTKSFQQKLADASAQAVAQTSEAVSNLRKDKQKADSDDESGSDEEGAPLPSIENTLIAPGKASSSLPLPKWGSGSNDPTNAAVRASPAVIMPVGMSEEEYRRLRAQNELTPQPPKITPASKRKASTPAAVAKTPASAVKEAVNQGKKIAAKTTELAKTIAKKTIAVESSGGEESSSSSEESNGATNQKKGKAGGKSPSTKSSTKSTSKSASPVEARKTQPAKPQKAKDPASMPPPTPKSTAKRRESMNKQQVERSSSSASTQATSSQQTSSKSSSSSPAPTKTPAKTKPQVNSAQSKKSTPATNKQPASAATASPAPAAKPLRPAIPSNRESALKLLRAKINSEAASPAPSLSSVTAKKKAAAIPVSSSSSSSEEESSSEESSDDKESVQKKRSLGKAKINTPLRVVKPDPSIRDASPDESGSSDED